MFSEIAKMTADSEKNVPYCLVCHSQTTSTRNSIDVFGEKAVTTLDRPIIKILSSILKTTINKESASSSIMCKKCTKLVCEVTFWIIYSSIYYYFFFLILKKIFPG